QEGITGSVADSGIGIAESDLPNLFQEFFRTDAAKATGEIGTGLGLAILKQILDSYGGTIDVQSQLGKGTQFTFTLPFERPRAAHQAVRVSGTHARVLGLGDDPAP